MSAAPLQILLVEDNPADVRLVEKLLYQEWEGPFRLRQADRLQQAFALVGEDVPDVILLDLELPDATAPETVRRLGALARHVPIVVLTGVASSTLLDQIISTGVQEYLDKQDLSFPGLLVARIRVARERGRVQAESERELLLEAERWRSERPLRVLHIEDSDADHALVRSALRDWEGPLELARSERAGPGIELLGQGTFDLVLLDLELPDGAGLELLERVRHAALDVPVLAVTASYADAYQMIRGGTQDYITKREVTLPGFLARALRFALARNHLFQALRSHAVSLAHANTRLEETNRMLSEFSPVGIFRADDEGQYVFVDERWATITGATRVEAMDHGWLETVHPDDREEVRRAWEGAVGEPRRFEAQWRVVRSDGEVLHVLGQSHPEFRDGAVVGHYGAITDVTETHQLQTRLLQAQRLESIGRLAGGVAHDFNNMLSAIIGYTEMARAAESPEALDSDLCEILRAAERASDITRQLLAFSRRQRIQARNVDLAHVLRGMEGLLERLIGEDIEVAIAASEGLGVACVDPGQIEQVVMNLVVNARDAMPRGGSIEIELRGERLRAPTLLGEAMAPAGEYLVLRVADTGAGMDATTLDQAFEPFFTTKEQGEGTGLGLATVHGIVQQHDAFMAVESQVGEGTAFRIYFPRLDAPSEAQAPEPVEATAPRGGLETVLLVEDEPQLRRLAARILRREGYEVLEAGESRRALEISEQHAGRIDLLLTDVVMPGMSGTEVAEEVRRARSDISILLMSGYSGDTIERYIGSGHAELPLLDKPFSPAQLAQQVREVLDGAPGARGT